MINPGDINILFACEESQACLLEFISMGFNAYSCDILPTSGPRPDRHIQDDVFNHLDKGWHYIISFPPCTHLAVSGAKHFDKKRADGRQEAGIRFFFKMWLVSDATENPIGIMNGGEYIKKWFPELHTEMKLAGFPFKSSQTIQPWQFGNQAQKSTCLWLKELPPLTPTKIVDKGEFVTTPSGKKLPKWYSDNKSANRSKTFPGISSAMAKQWGNHILNPPPKTTLF